MHKRRARKFKVVRAFTMYVFFKCRFRNSLGLRLLKYGSNVCLCGCPLYPTPPEQPKSRH